MRIPLLISIAIILAATYLLISGSEVLGWAIMESPYIPLGNVLTWMAAIALPMSLYFGFKAFRSPVTKLDKILRVALIISVVVSVLWYPVIWGLADNFSANFGGNGDFRGSAVAGEYFWQYTYFMIGFPLFLFFSFGMARLILRFKK